MIKVPYENVTINGRTLIVHGEDYKEFLLDNFSSMLPVKEIEGATPALYELPLSFRMNIFRAMEIVIIYGKKTDIEEFINVLNNALENR